mgnify:FL=1
MKTESTLTPRLISKKEAASYIGLSVSMLEKIIKQDPSLPVVRIGSKSRPRVLIDKFGLDVWISNNLESRA